MDGQVKEIEVQGVGKFQVPADYTDEQIREHILKLRREKPEIFGLKRTEQAGKKGFLTKAGEFIEDIAYPVVGAALGGAAGATLGPPGIVAGAGIGAMGGEAAKQLVRHATGRGEEYVREPNRAARDIATAGLFGPLQEAGPAMRAIPSVRAATAATTKSLTEAQKLAVEFGIPMTKAQQMQTPFRASFESTIRRAFGTQGIFRKRLETPQNVALKQASEEIADQISTTALKRVDAGAFVQDAVQDARKAAQSLYNDVAEQITAQGAGASELEISGSLLDRARDVISKLEMPSDYAQGFGDVQGRATAIRILKNFAETTKTVAGAGGKPVIVPKRLTVDEAINIRSALYDIADSGVLQTTKGEGALKQLSHTLHGEIKDALNRAGYSDLAGAFENASTAYRQTMEHIEHSTILRFVRGDKPELVADVLLSRGAESTAGNLRELLGPQKMEVVERALWEKILDKVLSGQEGVMVGHAIEREWNRLGPETQKAIWGSRPELLAKMDRFVKTTKIVSLSRAMMEPVSAQGSSLLAFGQFAGATAAAGGMARSVLQVDPGGFFLSLGGGASVMLAPQAIARLITRPGTIDVVNMALKTPATSKRGADMAWRLMQAVQAQAMKESFAERARRLIVPPEAKRQVEEMPLGIRP